MYVGVHVVCTCEEVHQLKIYRQANILPTTIPYDKENPINMNDQRMVAGMHAYVCIIIWDNRLSST